MSATTKRNTCSKNVIRQLVRTAAKSAESDRRSEQRFPYFRPVAIRINDRCFSAFSRDISFSAIGLINNMEFPEGEAELAIPGERGHIVKVRAHFERCVACGDGWYITAGKFLGADAE